MNENTSNRRRIAGFVVDSRAVLRFFIPIVLIIMTSAIFSVLSFVVVLDQLNSSLPDRPAIVHAVGSSMMVWGLVDLCVISLVSFVFGVVFSHRIFGPIVPIRKQINDLKCGRYDARIHLRPRDEFKELASDINELSRILGENRDHVSGAGKS